MCNSAMQTRHIQQGLTSASTYTGCVKMRPARNRQCQQGWQQAAEL